MEIPRERVGLLGPSLGLALRARLRRSKIAPGDFVEPAFYFTWVRIPQPNKRQSPIEGALSFILAEKVGFEPTWGV